MSALPQVGRQQDSCFQSFYVHLFAARNSLDFNEEDELRVDEPTRPEQLPTAIDSGDDRQSVSPFMPTSEYSMDGEGSDTYLLSQHTTTISNTYTYPESPLLFPRLTGGNTTEPTVLSLESTPDPDNPQNDKFCFCKDTSDPMDSHFSCQRTEQCVCKHCMGWKLWTPRGREIFERVQKREITIAIPDRSICRL
jgi:hypothetical protein